MSASLAMRIRYEDEEVQAAMRGLLKLTQDPADLNRALAFEGEQQTRERFNTQTAPDGTKWPQSLRAKIQGGLTLTDSGQLGDSMTSSGNRTRAQWGTNKIYAAVHQFGATITPKKAKALRFRLAGGAFVTARKVTIRARPYLGINAINKTAFLDIVNVKLRNALRDHADA